MNSSPLLRKIPHAIDDLYMDGFEMATNPSEWADANSGNISDPEKYIQNQLFLFQTIQERWVIWKKEHPAKFGIFNEYDAKLEKCESFLKLMIQTLFERCHPHSVKTNRELYESPFLKDIPKDIFPEIFQELKETPKELVTAEYAKALVVLFKDNMAPDRSQILITLKTYPQEARKEILGLFNGLMLGLKDRAQTFTPMLIEISKIPKDQRDSYTQRVAPLLQCIENGLVRVQILDFISQKPAKLKTEECIEAVVSIFQTSFDPNVRNSILAIIDWVPNEQLLEFTRLAIMLMKWYVNIDNQIEILEVIHKIPSEKVTLVLRQVMEIFLDKSIDHNLLSEVIFQTGLIPLDHLSKDCVEAIIHLNEMGIEADRVKIRDTLLWVSPDRRSEVVEILTDNPDIFFKNDEPMTKKLFLFSEEIQLSFYEYLSKSLNDLMPNQEAAFSLSSLVIQKASDLLLYDGHPILQQAYAIATISDPQALNNKTNPYRLFQWINTLPSTEPKLEIKSEFNIHILRQRGRYRELTIQDLPKNVSSKSLKRLFKRLDFRIKSLPEAQRNRIERYIQESFAASLKTLRANLLEKPLIPSLLDVRGAPNQPIEASVLYIHTIIKMVLDLEKEAESKGVDFLHPHEELLLSVSCSINDCSTGQKDGIANYYNQLPSKYRIGRTVDHKEEKVLQLIDQSVQKVLNETFASRELLRDLLPQNYIIGAFSQHAHQTLYLKNRLHTQVGLRHRPTFDPHSGEICTELLDVEPKRLLEAFFKLFTLKKVVHQVMQDASQAILQDKSAYRAFHSYLEPFLLSEKGDQPWEERCFQFTEDLKPTGLTERGVLILLKSISYISS